MWDKKDYVARTIQGVLGLGGLVGMIGLLYLVRSGFLFFFCFAGLFLLLKVCWRSVLYALTGKGSVNRDEF